MKILSITPISNVSQMPLKKGTLQFIQDAHKETTASTWKALIGSQYNPSAIYIIAGGLNTGQYPNYIIAAGIAFYNEEIFDFDAANFSVTPPNVAVFNISQTQYLDEADPVTFTDKTVRNIHNIRRLQITQGASGSGIANLSQGSYLNFAIPPQLNLSATGSAALSGVYPNLVIDVPLNANRNPVIYSGTYNVGDVGNVNTGGSVFTIPFSAPLATASYFVMGSIVSNGNPTVDSICTWSVHSRTVNNFIFNIQEFTGGVQNIAFEFIIFAK